MNTFRMMFEIENYDSGEISCESKAPSLRQGLKAIRTIVGRDFEGMFDLEELSLRLRPLMPLTALNTCWRFLDKGAESILDIGCGKGEPMKFINRARNFYVVVLDIFKPYLLKAKKNSTHDDYVLCDVRYMPVSSYEQHAYDNNPYQEHKYVWSVDEIKRLGYNVKGAGLKGIAGESGLAHKIPSFLKPILHALWIIAGIFTYNRPEQAGHMVLVKNLNK
jgi:SAM-dependent methyltransferase